MANLKQYTLLPKPSTRLWHQTKRHLLLKARESWQRMI